MKHKVLKIKEYLKEQSMGNLDGSLDARLIKAFAQYIQERKPALVKFQLHDAGSSCVKLNVKITITEDFPSLELLKIIYMELCIMVNQNNAEAIILNGLFVTPEIIDVYDDNKRYRGIIASVHYVK